MVEKGKIERGEYLFCDKLKELRESVGMNKKQFAEHIGVKYTTYNNYETGVREPKSDFLILIGTRFDISIDYLLELKETKDVIHSAPLTPEELDGMKCMVHTILGIELENLVELED